MSEKLSVVNTLSPLLTVQRGKDKYRFEYKKPVEVDYSEDATIIAFLLRNVQLQICNKKMLAELAKKEEPKKSDPTLVEKVEETKKEEKEKVEKKEKKKRGRKKKTQEKLQKYAEGMVDGVEEEQDENID